MTRYEKFLLRLLALCLLLAALGIADGVYFDWVLIVLSYSYLVAGYWLFRDQRAATDAAAPPNLLLKSLWVTTGIGLYFGLYYILWAYQLDQRSWQVLLLVGLSMLELGGYALALHRKGQSIAPVRPLLIRTVVVFVVGLFFSVEGSQQYAFYRPILLVLNQGHASTTNAILMHDYAADAHAALAHDDCAAALRAAQQSMVAGKRWLEADSVRQVYEISGIYQLVYEAYDCLGQRARQKKDFAQALGYYEQAYRAVRVCMEDSTCRARDRRWRKRPMWLLKDQAFCLMQLQRFTASDSLYAQALKIYEQEEPKQETYKAEIVAELAASYSKRADFPTSVLLYRAANRILASHKREYQTAARANSLAIITNLLMIDSVQSASQLLKKMRVQPADSDHWAYKRLCEGGVLTKQGRFRESNARIHQSLPYYRSPTRMNKSSEAVCYHQLAANQLALAYFDPAQASIARAQVILTPLAASHQVLYASTWCLSGSIAKARGDYPAAARHFQQALALYRSLGAVGGELVTTLVEQADLRVVLGQYAEALASLAEARPLLTPAAGSDYSPSQSRLLLVEGNQQLATGQVRAADLRYRRVLAIHRRYQQPQALNNLYALNGLLRTATAQHQLARADSALAAAQVMRAALLPERHPLTIALCLNGSYLRLAQHRPDEAAALVAQAQALATSLFPALHDVFGDVAMAQGQLAGARHQPAEARAFYQRAYEVYSFQFGADHPATKQARQRRGS